MNSTPETTPDRKRRYRERQKRGAVMVPVEVDSDVLEGLRECGCLDAVGATGTSDRTKVGEAIELLLYALASGEHVVILAEDAA